MSKASPTTKAGKYLQLLKAHALTFPEAYEDHPWGETVVKVKKKIFVFLGSGAGSIGASVKLPQSKYEALDLPFCKPTGYGLGKAGWISASFEEKQDVPVELLKDWISESYRAVAPKTLVRKLESGATPARRLETKTKKTKKGPAKKKAKKRARKTS